MSDKAQISQKQEFYKTKDPNLIFIVDEGVIKIGECELYVGKTYEEYKGREIKVIMKLGVTFINIIAVHAKSGKSINTNLTFN